VGFRALRRGGWSRRGRGLWERQRLLHERERAFRVAARADGQGGVEKRLEWACARRACARLGRQRRGLDEGVRERSFERGARDPRDGADGWSDRRRGAQPLSDRKPRQFDLSLGCAYAPRAHGLRRVAEVEGRGEAEGQRAQRAHRDDPTPAGAAARMGSPATPRVRDSAHPVDVTALARVLRQRLVNRPPRGRQLRSTEPGSFFHICRSLALRASDRQM